MCTADVGYPVFLPDMLLASLQHSPLRAHPLLKFFIRFDLKPYAEADLGPLQNQRWNSL